MRYILEITPEQTLYIHCSKESEGNGVYGPRAGSGRYYPLVYSSIDIDMIPGYKFHVSLRNKIIVTKHYPSFEEFQRDYVEYFL